MVERRSFGIASIDGRLSQYGRDYAPRNVAAPHGRHCTQRGRYCTPHTPTTDDLIERFLKRDDYRIIAEDGVADDLSKHNIEDEEDMVSEELAEIYAKQGLYDDAIDTYRKLSLLNSEKSIYFAELIANLEEQRKK